MAPAAKAADALAPPGPVVQASSLGTNLDRCRYGRSSDADGLCASGLRKCLAGVPFSLSPTTSYQASVVERAISIRSTPCFATSSYGPWSRPPYRQASILYSADLPQARRDHPRPRVLQLPRPGAEEGTGGPYRCGVGAQHEDAVEPSSGNGDSRYCRPAPGRLLRAAASSAVTIEARSAASFSAS